MLPRGALLSDQARRVSSRSTEEITLRNSYGQCGNDCQFVKTFVHLVHVGIRIWGSLILKLGNGLVQFSLLKERIAEVVVAQPAIRILGQRIGPECIFAFINPSPLPTRHPEDQQQSSTKGRLQPCFLRE